MREGRAVASWKGLQAKKGGRPSKEQLGPDPHLGALDQYYLARSPESFCEVFALDLLGDSAVKDPPKGS